MDKKDGVDDDGDDDDDDWRSRHVSADDTADMAGSGLSDYKHIEPGLCYHQSRPLLSADADD